jgi:hypothetical protein
MNQISQAPEHPKRAVSNFVKIRGDIHTTGVIDTDGKWKKSSIKKSFKYFVWTPLGCRVNIKIHFFLRVYFKEKEG